MAVDTQQSIAQPSQIDRVGPHPRLIGAWFLQFLQWKFSRIEHLKDPALHSKSYLWAARDHENYGYDSGILIDVATRVDPTTMGQRPALLVRPEGQKPISGLNSIGGNKLQLGHTLLGQTDPNQHPNLGHDTYHDWISGAHSIFCVHTDPAAAESLGVEVWWALLDHRHLIRRDCRLSRVDIPEGLSAPAQVKGDKDHWATSLMVHYIYQRTSLAITESPLLKGYSLTIKPSR